MNILFLKSHTFLTLEVENALRKRTDVKTITLHIPQYPDPSTVDAIIEQINPFLPALVISINDAGLDYDCKLQTLLIQKGCYLINWYHDYPFYEEIFQKRKMHSVKERIDFASEMDFVNEMTDRNFNAFFLPLATDPHYFFPSAENTFKRDISFVGNSSCLFLDSILNDKRHSELQKVLSLLSYLKKSYYRNPTFNIREYLLNNSSQWQGITALPDNEFIFLLEWLCGHFYRKDFICRLAENFGKRFTCFGDTDWKHFIDPALVSTEACYYTTLHEIYKASRINVNINRIQIRTSFTQRIFDCAACGAFILTDQRALNKEYFETDGSQKELVEFSSIKDCFRLIDYYLSHEEERLQIAGRARKKVLELHTYDNRIETMLTMCREFWGI